MVRYVILLTIAGIVGSIIAIRKGHSPILQQEKGVRSQRAVAQIKFFINQIVLNNKSLSNSDFNNWKNCNKY